MHSHNSGSVSDYKKFASAIRTRRSDANREFFTTPKSQRVKNSTIRIIGRRGVNAAKISANQRSVATARSVEATVCNYICRTSDTRCKNRMIYVRIAWIRAYKIMMFMTCVNFYMQTCDIREKIRFMCKMRG